MNEALIAKITEAIESAEVGYSLSLTRLVDGESTYTLTYSDGLGPLEFNDIADGYKHIRTRKRMAQAYAVIAALSVPAAAEDSELDRMRRELAEATVDKTSIDKLLAALKRAEDAEAALAEARSALEWMAARDDRNGSLPEAYRKKIDEALAPRQDRGGEQ